MRHINNQFHCVLFLIPVSFTLFNNKSSTLMSICFISSKTCIENILNNFYLFCMFPEQIFKNRKQGGSSEIQNLNRNQIGNKSTSKCTLIAILAPMWQPIHRDHYKNFGNFHLLSTSSSSSEPSQEL